MAIKGIFIGIDKYQDDHVRDLTGARRDALALWSLFKDTVPEMDAVLIDDAKATKHNVEEALETVLGRAAADDVVIMAFSGHGTHSHRFAVYDTSLNDLDGTTVPMQDLATLFKASPARTILCILDCCFSGGAPARVLEASPIPREINADLNMIAGQGRVLIAASNFDEPSYEVPGHGHGILTKALIDVFQSGEGAVNIASAMTEIMDRVRADAGRIGVVQTPVLLGYVEGGLTLPVLRPGQNYYTAFPDRRGARVTAAIADLAVFGIPTEVLNIWSRFFADGLNELQLLAVNEFRILDGESLLVVAPTSSGKTFIGELAASRAIVEGRKAVFLLPYRALVNEKFGQFEALYGQDLQFRVIRCTGDYTDQSDSFVRGKYDIAVLTYEMFLNIVLANPPILSQIGLVVIDEAQFIADPNRGINVELLLTHILSTREKGVSPQLIALSAVIGNINDFDAWLGCKLLVTTKRPVPLVEGVVDRNGVFQYLAPTGEARLEQVLPRHAIQVRREKPSAQDVIVPLVRQLMEKPEKVIIFRNQRGTAQGCAGYLAKELGLPPANEAISALPTLDLSSTSTSLRECLEGGTAFHSTNLSREERQIVEDIFRNPESNIRVLGATTTLAAGINTPASTVILAEQEFIGEDGRPFTVAEYKNMAGRAGRLGFREEGKAIILAETPRERENLFVKYVQGTPEPLRSSFEPEKLDTWIVRLLAQIKQIPRSEVVHLLANTYGGYIENKRNPGWRVQTEVHLNRLLDRMLQLGLLEQEQDRVQLTLLGRACGQSALSFNSAMRLVELVKGFAQRKITAIDLVAIVQGLTESDGGYTPMMKRGRSESVRSEEAARRYGNDIVRSFQRFAEDDFDYLARCKRASILWDWITGIALDVIEETYSPNPYSGRIGHGDVRKFADTTRFHLRSAHQIVALLIPGAIDATAIETVLKQLEVGIPADALDLLRIKIGMARGEYLLLYNRGIRTPEGLYSLEKAEIETIFGLPRANDLEKFRPQGMPARRGSGPESASK
jgi:helicase